VRLFDSHPAQAPMGFTDFDDEIPSDAEEVPSPRAKRKADQLDEEDDEDQFIQAKELQGEPCRAPNDEPAYPVEEDDDDDGPGFPALFDVDVDIESLTDLGQVQLHQGIKRMRTLVDENITRNMSMRNLVDLVSEFYQREIRANCSDAPVWRKRSIAKWILQHCQAAPERQAVDTLDAVYSSICMLRNAVGIRDLSGKIKPHQENIKLLLQASKVHANLVDSRIKREKR